MGILGRIFKPSRKDFFNPAGWVDYEGLKSQNKTYHTVLKSMFTKPEATNQETFEQAMQRLNLTEQEVADQAKTYRLYALLFFSCGTLSFVYAFYILFRYGTVTGWLLGMAATALFLANMFRFDFWALQIRRRKLGLTFKDWCAHILGEKGSPT